MKEGEYDLDWGSIDPCPDAIGPGVGMMVRVVVGLAAPDPPYRLEIAPVGWVE